MKGLLVSDMLQTAATVVDNLVDFGQHLFVILILTFNLTRSSILPSAHSPHSLALVLTLALAS